MLSRTCYIKIFTLRVGSDHAVQFRTPSGIQLHEVYYCQPSTIVYYSVIIFNRYEQKKKCKKMYSLSQSYNSILSHTKPTDAMQFNNCYTYTYINYF